MRKRSFSRRETLQGGAVVALMSGVSLGAAGAAIAQTVKRRRVDVVDPAAGAQAAADYRAAVAALKARGPAHPAGWQALSNVHRNFCPHGNWYFLPWHRAYLLAFEAICGAAIGKPDFALPYWNWTTFRQLPPGFVDQTADGQPNALFHAARDMKKNDTLSSMLAPFGVDAETIFGLNNIQTILNVQTFQQFGSFKPTGQNSIDASWQRRSGAKTALEREPHDYCHGVVGGDMGNPTISPQDPIFYLHHCNIDRIWARWNGMGRANESDAHWRNFVFRKNFPNIDGSAGGDVAVSSLGDTRALGYEYDDQPAVMTAASTTTFDLQALSALKLDALVKLNAASVLVAPQTAALENKVADIASTPIEKRASEDPFAAAGRLFVRLNGVTRPSDPKINVRVFLNCDYLTPMTPTDDPHYAGSFTFFTPPPGGHDGHDHADGLRQSLALDVTDTIKSLQALGLDPKAELQVQLMPVAFGGKPADPASFQVASIEFATI